MLKLYTRSDKTFIVKDESKNRFYCKFHVKNKYNVFFIIQIILFSYLTVPYKKGKILGLLIQTSIAKKGLKVKKLDETEKEKKELSDFLEIHIQDYLMCK
ncbi:hypothetical protein RFI_30085 [Reticulomyxa filosa]|uniref:Uncharacterized protein n=1 Tax=Reticulomyxa filosa TaxID=46433 RepID=X6LZF9_RETFI|nr:hypothetical protein RFI_30085 [Reticulomyxa filosa]|eukprot:ETO07308.1 hypothetical protein RFI_30085 [Reticulomyxa filosa]